MTLIRDNQSGVFPFPRSRPKVNKLLDAGLSLSQEDVRRSKYAQLSEELATSTKEREQTRQLELRHSQDQAMIARLQNELAAMKHENALLNDKERQREAQQPILMQLQENNLNRSETHVSALKLSLASLQREHEACGSRISTLEAEIRTHKETQLEAIENNSLLGKQLNQARKALQAAERVIFDLQKDAGSERAASYSSATYIGQRCKTHNFVPCAFDAYMCVCDGTHMMCGWRAWAASLRQQLDDAKEALQHSQYRATRDRQCIEELEMALADIKQRLAECESENANMRRSKSLYDEIEGLKHFRRNPTALLPPLFPSSAAHLSCHHPTTSVTLVAWCR